MIRKINKTDMIHMAGTIYNYILEDAMYVKDVTNEDGEKLKFCYNMRTKILCVLDYKKDFTDITIEYDNHDDLH